MVTIPRDTEKENTGGKEAKQKEKAKDLSQIFIQTETVTSCASWLVKVS